MEKTGLHKNAFQKALNQSGLLPRYKLDDVDKVVLVLDIRELVRCHITPTARESTYRKPGAHRVGHNIFLE